MVENKRYVGVNIDKEGNKDFSKAAFIIEPKDEKAQRQSKEYWKDYSDLQSGSDEISHGQKEEVEVFYENIQSGMKTLNDPKEIDRIKSMDDSQKVNFANELAILSEQFGNVKENELTNMYKDLPDKETKDESLEKDRFVKEQFMKVCKNMFPNAKPLKNVEDVNTLFNEIKSTEAANILGTLERALKIISESNEPRKKIDMIDDLIREIGGNFRGSGNFGSIDTFHHKLGVLDQNKPNVLKATKVLYQLEMARNVLQKETYGKEDCTREEKDKIDEIRENLNSQRFEKEKPQNEERRENAKKTMGKEMSFLSDRLGYPFNFNSHFSKLSDDRLSELSEKIHKIATEFRLEIKKVEKKKDFTDKVNELLNAYRP